MTNELRCVIAGSRDITSYEFVESIIDKCPWKDEITSVLSGTANGVDKLGEQWAQKNNIQIERYPANWDRDGKSAGPKRNKIMAGTAHAAIIIHKLSSDGVGSKGTQNMKELAEHYKLKLYYVPVRPKTTFSLAQLKELESQLEGKGMVGGDLVRRILGQFIKQLEEYQQVAHDARLLWNALASVEHYIDWDHLYPDDKEVEEEIKRAFATPTAKLIQELVKEQNEISNTNRS